MCLILQPALRRIDGALGKVTCEAVIAHKQPESARNEKGCQTLLNCLAFRAVDHNRLGARCLLVGTKGFAEYCSSRNEERSVD